MKCSVGIRILISDIKKEEKKLSYPVEKFMECLPTGFGCVGERARLVASTREFSVFASCCCQLSNSRDELSRECRNTH